jgi:hypothetical protein
VIEVAFKYMPRQDRVKAIHKDAQRISTNWSKAFEKLRYELARIKATEVVIEAGYKASQVRADGWPYSSAKPEHGQVRVSFKKAGTLAMAFLCGGWREVEQNVYMIALTLERLRAIERYGCVQSEEQYRGWARLPAGNTIAMGEWATAEDALRWLASVAGFAATVSLRDLDQVYRAASRKAHPDLGGSDELMAKVNRAKEYIEKAVAR